MYRRSDFNVFRIEREYRTYFHISQGYGLSESVCDRICKDIENTLIKTGNFSLPEKKSHSKK